MKALILAILLVSMLCVVPSQAATSSARVEFKDTLGNTINAVGGKYNINLGQTFTADVYFTSSVAWAYYDVAFGWGTATKQGTTATDLSADFTAGTYDYKQNAAICDTVYTVGKGGFTAYTGSRPYGSFIASDRNKLGTCAAATEYKLVTYTLTNKMAHGDTGTICIYGAGYGMTPDEWTSKVYDVSGSFLSRPATINYSMSSIPEPSSMMAMGCAGVGVLGDLLRRRRKRSSAKK